MALFIKTVRQEFPERVSKVCRTTTENIVSLFLSSKDVKQSLGMIILPDSKSVKFSIN